jgi:hypothetical protein
VSIKFAQHVSVPTPRLLLALFLVAQVFDGLFTYIAVRAFGLLMEGNVLLATWMSLVGPGPALIGAKLLAAGCGIILYWLDVRRALLAVTVFYGVVAIGPWLFVLHL